MAQTNLGVKVRNGNVEKALSIFKKRVKQDEIIQEYKSNQEYQKPSTKKRLALKKAKYQSKKDQEKNW